jgi:MFS transporter, DHA1 family, multidrug resistance protein
MNKPNSIVSISTIVFVLTIGTGMVAPLLAPYSQKLGASGIWVGLIYSGFYMVRFMIGTPIGKLADRFGPKGILVISMSIYPFIALSYFVSDSLMTLLGARLLHGVASAMLLPMAMTYIGEVTPKGKEGMNMGIYNTVLFLANGLGPILGGFIADWWGVKEVFLLLLLLAIVTLVLTVTSLSSTRKGSELIESKREIQANVNVHHSSVWKNGSLMALSSIFFISAVLTMFIVSFFPLFGTEKGLSTLQIGILIAIYNLTVGILQIPFGKMADKYNKIKLLYTSSFGVAILFFIIPKLGSFALLGGFVFLFSVFTAVVVASSSAVAAETGQRFGMGRTMGYLSSATSLGMVIGPLVSGLMTDLFSTSWLFFAIGGGWVLSALAVKLNNSKLLNNKRSDFVLMKKGER